MPYKQCSRSGPILLGFDKDDPKYNNVRQCLRDIMSHTLKPCVSWTHQSHAAKAAYLQQALQMFPEYKKHSGLHSQPQYFAMYQLVRDREEYTKALFRNKNQGGDKHLAQTIHHMPRVYVEIPLQKHKARVPPPKMLWLFHLIVQTPNICQNWFLMKGISSKARGY
ncbi:hypothetical protein A0H81_00300 [Grifola frondosa]|uniref:Uncharacterized protein n=1 Tax=Grifola frondosa TaxID=5627 RepID=A0A1C7MRD8_GRIFR|nr:hypothetical protein A0H81_00300 [Grifola frondosa]